MISSDSTINSKGKPRVEPIPKNCNTKLFPQVEQYTPDYVPQILTTNQVHFWLNPVSTELSVFSVCLIREGEVIPYLIKRLDWSLKQGRHIHFFRSASKACQLLSEDFEVAFDRKFFGLKKSLVCFSKYGEWIESICGDRLTVNNMHALTRTPNSVITRLQSIRELPKIWGNKLDETLELIDKLYRLNCFGEFEAKEINKALSSAERPPNAQWQIFRAILRSMLYPQLTELQTSFEEKAKFLKKKYGAVVIPDRFFEDGKLKLQIEIEDMPTPERINEITDFLKSDDLRELTTIVS